MYKCRGTSRLSTESSLNSDSLSMSYCEMGLGEEEVWFSEPSHAAPFVMFVDRVGYLDVEERLPLSAFRD